MSHRSRSQGRKRKCKGAKGGARRAQGRWLVLLLDGEIYGGRDRDSLAVERCAPRAPNETRDSQEVKWTAEGSHVADLPDPPPDENWELIVMEMTVTVED